MFSFEWAELRQVLEQLAANPVQRDRVKNFVGGIEKQSSAMSRTETLQLIATAAHLIQLEDPRTLIEDAEALSRLH